MLSIQKSDLEQYNQLIDELFSIISEMSFRQAMDEIEKRHRIGETIINSGLYKKYSKGSGRFLERVAKDLKKGTTWVYESVKFYEKYPDVSAFVQTFNPDKKVIRWADVRKELLAPAECPHEETEKEIIEIQRERCIKCSKIVSEIKNNLSLN
jgi:hypothetical protein